MKCPNDGTEMERGRLPSPTGSSIWIPEEMNEKNEQKVLGMTFMKPRAVIAWRCPKCGKVELSTEPEKEEEK